MSWGIGVGGRTRSYRLGWLAGGEMERLVCSLNETARDGRGIAISRSSSTVACTGDLRMLGRVERPSWPTRLVGLEGISVIAGGALDVVCIFYV